MDTSNIRIETDRLILLSSDRSYAQHIFDEYRDPVTLFMNYPPPDNIEVLKQRMLEREKQMQKGEILYLVVLLKDGEEFIGSFALEGLSHSTPEMGGWIKRGAQGKGYGKEVVAAIKKWADDHLDYQHIIWPCAKINKASCKLAEALNGSIVKEYLKMNKTGLVWDYVEYHIASK